MNRNSILNVGAALLVVLATFVAVPMSGAAATQGYTYDNSPATLAVNTDGISGEITVEFSTSDGFSSETVIAKETYQAASVEGEKITLHNGGAYEHINVTVSGTTNATFEELKGIEQVYFGAEVIGSTGGDRDRQCDTGEKLAAAARPHVPQLDCNANPGSTAVNTTGLDTTQTKTELYQSAQNSHAQEENAHAVMENYLQDTETQAKIVGKNAYIRALNNGSSEAAATTEAKNAVSDYYSTKQVNLLKQYETQALQWKYLRDKATTDGLADVNDGYHTDGYVGFRHVHPENDGGIRFKSMDSTSATLANGSTVSYQSPRLTLKGGYDSNDHQTVTISAHSDQGTLGPSYSAGEESIELRGSAVVRPPTTDYDPVYFMEWDKSTVIYTDLESQKDTVHNEIDTLVNNTYTEYQDGEINNTDLVDPYVLDNSYSAGDSYQTWTAATLSRLGQNSPQTLDQIGHMNVTNEDTGNSYSGLLLSQTNPESGEFEVNTTYDTADISGSQYLITEDKTRELNGNITLTEVTTSSGETQANFTIEKKDYDTANVSELKALYADLNKEYAELEARQSNLQAAGGGALFGGSNNGIAVVLLAGAAFLIYKEGSED